MPKNSTSKKTKKELQKHKSTIQVSTAETQFVNFVEHPVRSVDKMLYSDRAFSGHWSTEELQTIKSLVCGFFRETANGQHLQGLLKEENRAVFLESFCNMFFGAMQLFVIKDQKYGEQWMNDGLDARTLFVELQAKVARLKQMIWVDWNDRNDSQFEIVNNLLDSMVFILMLAHRLGAEEGFDIQEQLQTLIKFPD